jgi:hypothetical protein
LRERGQNNSCAVLRMVWPPRTTLAATTARKCGIPASPEVAQMRRNIKEN